MPDQDLPQPGQELLLRLTAKLADPAVDLEKRLLHDVGDVQLALDPPANLDPGQEEQVVPVPLEQLSKRRAIPLPCPVKQLGNLRSLLFVPTHPRGLSERSVTKAFGSRREFLARKPISPSFRARSATSGMP